MRLQMFTTSRIQETKMQYDTNVYHLQNMGDKDAIRYRCLPPLEYRRQRCDYKCLPPLDYRRQRCNMIQMFTTSRIQETKMQYDTNAYHLQNIGDKDAIRYRYFPPLGYRRQRCDYKYLPPLEYRRPRSNMIQMFTTSRIQQTKMRLQMFTTSRIQATKMQYDTNIYHLQNIGDKDAI